MDLDVARILDANANRAREGLRTAEDYVRFILGDLNYSERLRLLRQALTDILLAIPGLEHAQMESRNVTLDPLQPENWKDVLRRIDSETPLVVAQRGMKRAQEALRVMEEYLRGSNGPQAERVAKLRYGTYEAEQWLVCASPAMQILQTARVCVLLTAELCKGRDVLKSAQSVLNGGVKIIQYREKQQPDSESIELLKTLGGLCRDAGAILICNDRVDLALLSAVHGVHLGQTDISPQEARKLSARRLLIGRSTHSADQAVKAVEIERADYIGIGSMFETQTKPKAQVGGIKLAQDIVQLKLNVPVFAIGGITFAKLAELKSCGISRVAVSSAILGSASPECEARKFTEFLST